MNAMFTVLCGLAPSQRWPVVIWLSKRAIRLRARGCVFEVQKEIAGDGQVVAAQNKALNIGLVELTHFGRQS